MGGIYLALEDLAVRLWEKVAGGVGLLGRVPLVLVVDKKERRYMNLVDSLLANEFSPEGKPSDFEIRRSGVRSLMGYFFALVSKQMTIFLKGRCLFHFRCRCSAWSC